MNAATGTWQLRRVIIRYSETGGSSLGTRFYLRHLLPELLNLQRNSESPNLYLRHGGPRVWTERRSIQGLWQPSAEGMFRVAQLQATLEAWGKLQPSNRFELILADSTCCDLKKFLDECGLRHSDCFEKKAKILAAGGSVAGCVFKEDYLERARQMFLSGGSAGPDSGKKSYE
eukprot:Skav212905  [mRNA]  locus=scaffold374:148530:152298:- [translate_table: standard]